MAAGPFFSSLMGSYTDAVRKKHKDELDQQEKRIDSELEVLKLAVRDPSITQQAREAAFERMEELTQGKGKKKSGFSFKNLIGKFQDVGGPQGKNLEQATAARQQQQSPGAAPPSQGTAPQAGGAAPAWAAPTGQGHTPSEPAPPVPTRGQVFKTDQQMNQQEIDRQKGLFEQVDKPRLDYEHELRMKEIEKQYGSKLIPRNKIVGSSVPPSITTDTGGKPIDPKKEYTVLFNNQNQPIAAMEEYERPASSRASGPEAKVESLKKDILADAQGRGQQITEQQAEIQARQLMLRQARATLSATLESTRGREFANKVRAALESGIMTPATAKAVISYASTEAKRRWENPAPPKPGERSDYEKSLGEIEEEIFEELGTTREQIRGYLRQGAKGPKGDEPGAPKKANRFDPNLQPVPSRP